MSFVSIFSDGVQSKCCISGIVYKVFIVQWAFMFASAIFAYFFIGDFVQGKIIGFTYCEIG